MKTVKQRLSIICFIAIALTVYSLQGEAQRMSHGASKRMGGGGAGTRSVGGNSSNRMGSGGSGTRSINGGSVKSPDRTVRTNPSSGTRNLSGATNKPDINK